MTLFFVSSRSVRNSFTQMVAALFVLIWEGLLRHDCAPFTGRVATHRKATSLGMTYVPKPIEQKDDEARTYCETAHKNTNKQSDTSNE